LQKGSDWGRFVFLAVFFPNAQHKFFCQLVHLVWGNFLDFTIHVFAFKKLLTQFQIVKRFSLSVYVFLFFLNVFKSSFVIVMNLAILYSLTKNCKHEANE
jgi:hypothetical protein